MNKLAGTYSDFGVYLAKKLAERNHSFDTRVNRRTLSRQTKLYRKYWPGLIEESAAIASYLGMSEEEVLYDAIGSTVDSQRLHVAESPLAPSASKPTTNSRATRAGKLTARTHPAHASKKPPLGSHDSQTDACTIFAIHEGDKVFVGRNYDWDPSARDYFQCYDLKIGGTYRYFAFSDEGTYPRHFGRRTWKLYAEDAINQHGLYIGLTASKLREKYWGYGFSSYHMIRYIAEHCRTTAEALRVFRQIPLAVPKNFLIADRSGDLAVIEHAARSYRVLRPQRHGTARYLVHTNHCLDPDYAKIDPVLATNPTADTFLRYAEADFLIRTQLPGYQFTDLWRALRSSHYVYSDDTIWSLALELSEPRLTYYRDTAQGQKESRFAFE